MTTRGLRKKLLRLHKKLRRLQNQRRCLRELLPRKAERRLLPRDRSERDTYPSSSHGPPGYRALHRAPHFHSESNRGRIANQARDAETNHRAQSHRGRACPPPHREMDRKALDLPREHRRHELKPRSHHKPARPKAKPPPQERRRRRALRQGLNMSPGLMDSVGSPSFQW